MTKPLNFQQIIMTLQRYWADLGFVVWQPYHESVGAGTANPATILRVLGPEPWNVAYVEPSFRPDDGRFGDNPNRMQMHHQFQVIIQPDPGNPQELYLNSLFALGLKQDEHDIRFVEDNWESPALGAWGLGWEVWLDGMEISQYTYFQQAGGHLLDPVAVELTYGLERIAMYLQNVKQVWDIDWDGQKTYGDILLRQEIEYCEYNFNVGDVQTLVESYNFYEAECERCLKKGLVIPAHDYVLKCSHTFNVLDTRGAIGVTERASYFKRMRNMSRQVAKAFIEQRQSFEFPLMKYMPTRIEPELPSLATSFPAEPTTFLFEIGSEELPSHDVTSAIAQLNQLVPEFLTNLRLTHGQLKIMGTPRRLVIVVKQLASRQTDLEETARGPATNIAYDANGNPTKAAIGFARGKGIDVSELQKQVFNGKEHVVATVQTTGLPASEILAIELPNLIRAISFGKSMRWLASAQVGNVADTTYSRPLRWFVSLLGEQVIPFAFAGVVSGRTSRGLRSEGSPEIEITQADAYLDIMNDHEVMVDHELRQADIKNQLDALASEVGGLVPDEAALLEEVTYLVEKPTALIGSFDENYLNLPDPILITVMKKHQRYFPVISRLNGSLLPYFIAVRNGGTDHLSTVRRGNEGVLRARYADADFFFKADTKKTLAEFLPRLATLTFQEQLGSMLDKSKRVEQLALKMGQHLALDGISMETLARAAQLFKADLATNMVVELTSLQGIMGYEYAKLSGETEAVATAIVEHYYPQTKLPHDSMSRVGLILNLANRIDSLCGLFAVGKAPTGSADPFALRRDALSLVSVLIENQLTMNLTTTLQWAAKLMPVDVSESALTETVEFIQRRLEGVLRDEYNLAHDVVQAVLAEQGHNPWLALSIAQGLTEAINQEEWEQTLTAYARCVRIVRSTTETYSLQPDGFAEPAEKALYAAYQQAKSTLTPETPMAEVVQIIRTVLVAPINQFFDKVMVMAEDETVRNNRLALMQAIRGLTQGYADFSHLQGF